MACHDRYGLPLSTSSEAAAAAYRDGVDLMLSAWPGAAEALDAAIAADPDFALAHIGACPRMRFIYADVKAAQARAATARELVARNGSAREKSHVETLALGMEGQSAKSLGLRARASRRMAARCARLRPADGGVRPLRILRHGRSRSGACRPVRATCSDTMATTGSSSPHLGWSHTENGNVGARPRHHPARVRRQARERATRCTRWRTRCSRTDRATMPSS